MPLSINLNTSKKPVVAAAVLLLVALGGLIYLEQASKNPLPADTKRQVSYKVIYPSATSQIDGHSYRYQADKAVLNFNVKKEGNNIVFTEQPAPSSLGADTQVYYPALGIHPYAQFQTRLGPVALTKFWQSGSLQPIGQAGVLATHGTFLIAHSEKNLTNDQWKDLFESLKLTK